MPLIAIRNKM